MLLDQKSQGGGSSSLIGLFLIFAVLIAYSYLTMPTRQQLEEVKRRSDSLAAEKKPHAVSPATGESSDSTASALQTLQTLPSARDTTHTDSLQQQALLMEQYGPFSASARGEEKMLIMENESLKVSLSTKGGRIAQVELKKYRTHDSLPLLLIHPDSSHFGLTLFAGARMMDTQEMFFVPENPTSSPGGEERNSIAMRLYADGSKSTFIEYRYALNKESYLVDFTLTVKGLDSIIPANTNYMELDWNIHSPLQEKSMKNERMNTTLYYRYFNEEVDYLSETSDDEKTIQTRLHWLAFKQQFFTSALMADKGFEKPTKILTQTDKGSEKYVRYFAANITIPYEHRPLVEIPMRFYFGPNHYQTLKKLGVGMEEIIPLGWGIFGWFNMWLIIPIFNFLEQYVVNYGIIILILTIIIKVLLFPLMYRSYLSTAKMRVLKPEIDAIGARFPKQEDAMKKQQAVMALYKKCGVNPLDGCLPMLVQLPILIAMYRFFPASIELRQEPFLWADDLSTYDSIWDFGYVPLINLIYGDHVSLFTLLMTAASFLSIKWNSELSGGTQMQMPQMKLMMYMMPFFFLGFFNNFSAALSYYYFISTMITFAQQLAMKKFVDEEALLAKIEEHRARPAPPKSAFQKRLEKMAKRRG